jgi:S1-C subfamily serine protease
MSFWIVIGLFFTVFVNLTASDSLDGTAIRAPLQLKREAAVAVRQKVAACEAALKVREEIIADTNGARSVTVSSGSDGSLGLDVSDFALVAVPGTNLYGVQLGGVERNSAAGLSGLREKDIAIEFDGASISSVEDFAARIKRATPGSTIKAVVMRGTERLEIPVRVGQDD